MADQEKSKIPTQIRTGVSQLSTALESQGFPKIDLDNLGQSPYPSWLISASTFSLCLKGLRQKPGYPGFLPLIASSLLFAGTGYAIKEDPQNGTSTATAWGIVYTSMFAKDAFKSGKIGPISLTSYVVCTTLLYGAETWDSYFG